MTKKSDLGAEVDVADGVEDRTVKGKWGAEIEVVVDWRVRAKVEVG